MALANQRYVARVVSSRQLTPSSYGIILEKPPGFSFRPTQFTFLQIETDEGADARPMSLATSPTRSTLEYGIRISDSSFKRAFVSLRKGDEVLVQGPFGDFILDEERPAVLLAGGIGITPLKGMAEYAADKGLLIDVRLVYSNREEEEIAYRAELEELEKRNPRFSVVHTLTGAVAKRWRGRTGRIDARLLQETTHAIAKPVYYICGTPGMVSSVFETLVSGLSVPEEDIRAEVFRGYWKRELPE
jgi:ferredoxin-NADP reductase